MVNCSLCFFLQRLELAGCLGLFGLFFIPVPQEPRILKFAAKIRNIFYMCKFFGNFLCRVVFFVLGKSS